MGGVFEAVLGGRDVGGFAVCAVVSGVLAAAGVWLLLGWEREDAARTVRIWKQLAVREAKLLAQAALQVCRALGNKLGLVRSGDRSVSLGGVSEMIDIVRLGLTAGLSFDAALGLYCKGRTGLLSETMGRARLSWQTGLMTREESLLAAAHELGVKPLESFAIAVSQALELGAPLADTLEAQGKEIRAVYRAEVERQIERAPVKLLIPTGTLILPALLLSIVGPLVAAGGMM